MTIQVNERGWKFETVDKEKEKRGSKVGETVDEKRKTGNSTLTIQVNEKGLKFETVDDPKKSTRREGS